MKTKPQFPLTIEDYTKETNLPQFTQFSQLLPSTNGDDLAITKVKADTLVRLASFEVGAIRIRENSRVQIAQIQADALVSVENTRARVAMYRDYTAMETERIRAHSREVSDLIAATSSNMSKALEMYRGFYGSYKVTVKTKRGWIFGKSCTMTVKAESYPAYYYRGPSR